MKVVFLDRDGVINVDRSDYVKSWSEFEFLPGSLEALRLLTEQDRRIIVITNQSVIGRKLVTQDELDHIHRNMKAAVQAHGGRIEAVFYCPHTPADGCPCRKPKAGLIQQACEVYGIDRAETCMIGDSLKDMQCARTAGCGKAVLVRTGYGVEAEALCHKQGIALDHVSENLLGAVRWLLSVEPREA